MKIGYIAASLCAPLLSGCFFVFIPGALVQKASDGLTGAEGEHCVSEAVKVGDKLTTPNGQVGTVASLSGTSSRCTNPATPIRAKVTV